jgi:HK97 gp10 family phage protein
MPRLKQSRNTRGIISLDPASVEKFKKDMEHLQQATRREIVEKALYSGGIVIHNAAELKAPGPHIVIDIFTGAELMRGWTSAVVQGIKVTDLYAVVGPDDEHWYYRFAEYGVKAHGVERRKRTRKEINLRISMGRVYRSSIKKAFEGKRPAMVFEINGKLIFARHVKGKAARPFMRPAFDSKGGAAMNEVGQVIASEIDKVARK